jgi:hypothetical protein
VKYYRLMTMLPPLPTQPERPPQALGDLIEVCLEELDAADRQLARALVGYLDCRNLEAALSNHDVFDERGLLPRSSLAERSALPDFLLSFLQAREAGKIPTESWQDSLWQAYYAHLLQVAEQHGSKLIGEWANFELSLRAQLVSWRAEHVGPRSVPGLAAAMAAGSDDFAILLAALREEPDPMERERLLDLKRMEKIDSLSGVDPFSSDAALAYVLTSLLLDQWDFDLAVDPAALLEAVA